MTDKWRARWEPVLRAFIGAREAAGAHERACFVGGTTDARPSVIAAYARLCDAREALDAALEKAGPFDAKARAAPEGTARAEKSP